MPRICISIDLDSLYCYQQIFGLPADMDDNIVYERGLSRFAELMDEAGLVGTLFAVGRDLDMGDNAARLAGLARRGFEIGNHSANHDYRLTRLPRREMEDEVVGGRARLEAATGAPVVGFRAPGYTLNPTLLDVLVTSGHVYDSSVFPCVPYYGAKAAALALLRMGGKQSRSILGDPRVLAAPRVPYRLEPKSWWKADPVGSLWEFPIGVTPFFRFPFLGSFLILWGERKLPSLFNRLARTDDLLVAEFHGMDFLDGPGDGLDPALIRQPDMRVDWPTKRRLFRRLFSLVAEHGGALTLAQAARDRSKEPDALVPVQPSPEGQ